MVSQLSSPASHELFNFSNFSSSLELRKVRVSNILGKSNLMHSFSFRGYPKSLLRRLTLSLFSLLILVHPLFYVRTSKFRGSPGVPNFDPYFLEFSPLPPNWYTLLMFFWSLKSSLWLVYWRMTHAINTENKKGAKCLCFFQKK